MTYKPGVKARYRKKEEGEWLEERGKGT